MDIRTVSEARRMLALQASWEIEALCAALAPSLPEEASDLHLRGMLLRVKQLSGLIMDALDDDMVEDAHIRFKLTGIREVQHGH